MNAKPKTDTAKNEIEAVLGDMPSMHIEHSTVFQNELSVRIGGFDTGIMTLTVEMDGLQRAYEADAAKRAEEHAAAIEQRHRLKRDLERGRRMALAAQAAYDEPIPADIEGQE